MWRFMLPRAPPIQAPLIHLTYEERVNNAESQILVIHVGIIPPPLFDDGTSVLVDYTACNASSVRQIICGLEKQIKGEAGVEPDMFDLGKADSMAAAYTFSQKDSPVPQIRRAFEKYVSSLNAVCYHRKEKSLNR